MSVFALWLACAEERPIDLAAALPALREQLAERSLAAEWVEEPLVAGVGPAYQVRGGDTRATLGVDRLTATDARAAAPTWAVGLALTRWGGAGDLRTVEAGVASAAGARAEVRRPGIVEWVEGTPAGPEHGFTVFEPPAGDELVLELVASGGVPRQLADRVRIRGGAGGIDWAHLAVWDDARRPLPARTEVEGQIVRVRANVAGARFPVTVDPLLLVVEAAQTLTGLPGQPASSLLGASLALDQDRLLIGDPGTEAADQGVVACLRPSLGWGAEWSWSPSGFTGAGTSVGLHGRTAVVAGRGSSLAVYAYDRDAEDWEARASLPLACVDCADLQVDLGPQLLVVGQPGEGGGLVELWARDPLDPGVLSSVSVPGGLGAVGDGLGSAVATDGAYVAAGAPGSGRVRVWRRAGAAITSFGSLATEDASFGAAVDLDGHRLAVGAPEEGRVYLYILTEDGAIGRVTVDAPAVAGAGFGARVALAGSTLVVLDHPVAGDLQAHLFELGAVGWGWRDSFVVGPDGPSAATLALSDDWLAVARPDAGEYSVWSREGDALKWIGAVTDPGQVTDGGAVAVDGDTIAVGNYKPAKAKCPGVAVFEREEDGVFALQQTLTDCSDDALFPDEEDGLGDSVAVAEREVLVAGNPRYGLGDTYDYGRAVVWRHDGTEFVDPQVLYPPEAIGDLRFGRSVATDGERLVVGQPNYEGADFDFLSQAYVYTRDAGGTWVETQGVGKSILLNEFFLGEQVGLGDGLVVVGGGTRFEVYDADGVEWLALDGGVYLSFSGARMAVDRGSLVFSESVTDELFVVDFDEIGAASAATMLASAGHAVAVDGERLVTTRFDDSTDLWMTTVRRRHEGVWAVAAERQGTPRGASGRLVVVEAPDGALDLFELAAANLPPTARDDAYTGVGGTEPVLLGSVLFNDTDGDLDTLILELASDPVPASIVVTLHADGTFQLTPPFGQTLPDQVTFEYRITDGAAEDEATVTVALTEPPPPTDTDTGADDPPPRQIRLVSACDSAPTGGGAGAVLLLAALLALRRRPGHSSSAG